jgi:hypothetical protein
VPSPWPSTAEVIATHGARETTLQVQSRVAPMVSVPLPPDEGNDSGAAVTLV